MKSRDNFYFLAIIFIFFYLQFAFAQVSEEDKTCITAGCHNKLVDQRYLHPPLEDGCSFCHESQGAKHPDNPGSEFTLVEEAPDLCYSCHDEKNVKQTVHPPVEEGDCQSCHDVHSSPNKFLLMQPTIEQVCADCHDNEMWTKKWKHEPVKAGECTSCHNPHQADADFLLKADVPEICFQCHDKQKQQETLETVHPPFEDDCLSCHAPHSASESKKLLLNKVPSLCFDCHDDQKEALQTAKLIHKPVQDKKTCLNCHSPHATNPESLLKKDMNALCLQCHNREIKTKTRTIPNIAEKIKTSPVVHPPVEEDYCTTCHKPHTSDFSFLLQESFPEGNYAPGDVKNYQLCFSCHDSELLTDSLTTDATEFRNGRKNLHFLHVNREKGRTCTDCHDVHASKFPKLIGSSVQFGKWKMPIEFQLLENGGSCLAGCHERKIYQRSNP